MYEQGGVLSLILFTMYIDDLLIEVKHSRYGCHAHGILILCITLLFTSLYGLDRMQEVCAKYEDNI